MMQKAAAKEREIFSDVCFLRYAERQLTEIREKELEAFSKLDTEERDLRQKVSIIQKKKRSVAESRQR
ncbi:hypothetical protein R1flu_013533 [Riccia fluitans]|uniref:Uncharacterized protein n=1 Tax=Riccia fluitans TaxID=41844 RepID=A0ABD1YDN3_9MARC